MLKSTIPIEIYQDFFDRLYKSMGYNEKYNHWVADETIKSWVLDQFDIMAELIRKKYQFLSCEEDRNIWKKENAKIIDRVGVLWIWMNSAPNLSNSTTFSIELIYPEVDRFYKGKFDNKFIGFIIKIIEETSEKHKYGN